MCIAAGIVGVTGKANGCPDQAIQGCSVRGPYVGLIDVKVDNKGILLGFCDGTQ